MFPQQCVVGLGACRRDLRFRALLRIGADVLVTDKVCPDGDEDRDRVRFADSYRPAIRMNGSTFGQELDPALIPDNARDVAFVGSLAIHHQGIRAFSRDRRVVTVAGFGGEIDAAGLAGGHSHNNHVAHSGREHVPLVFDAVERVMARGDAVFQVQRTVIVFKRAVRKREHEVASVQIVKHEGTELPVSAVKDVFVNVIPDFRDRLVFKEHLPGVGDARFALGIGEGESGSAVPESILIELNAFLNRVAVNGGSQSAVAQRQRLFPDLRRTFVPERLQQVGRRF